MIHASARRFLPNSDDASYPWNTPAMWREYEDYTYLSDSATAVRESYRLCRGCCCRCCCYPCCCCCCCCCLRMCSKAGGWLPPRKDANTALMTPILDLVYGQSGDSKYSSLCHYRLLNWTVCYTNYQCLLHWTVLLHRLYGVVFHKPLGRHLGGLLFAGHIARLAQRAQRSPVLVSRNTQRRHHDAR